MVQLRDIFQCEHCKLLVEVVNDQGVGVMCCNNAMSKLEAKTQEQEGKEKHTPVIEEVNGGVKVSVGSVEHPMAEDHYIKFIEVIGGGKVLRKELNPGDKPEATFCCISKADIDEVREFCTTHGLWKS